MKYLLVILPLLLLSACGTPKIEYIIKKEFVPLEINKADYPCPYIPSSELPPVETITTRDLLLQWANSRRDNAICSNSIHTVFKTIEAANEKIDNAAK